MNYLNKKDMLREIDASKQTYSSYTDMKFAGYHATVANKSEITDELIEEIITSRAKAKGRNVPIVLRPNEVVVRVMTHEHIPLDPDRKRKARNTDQSYARTNFPPFKHYIKKDDDLIEVGRSHWNGSIEDGEFCMDHGTINNRLALMFILLVDRIASKGNYRGYSYIDEMRAYALMQLCQTGLMFDESRSDNPFAFFTTAVNHSFVRVLNIEKKAQRLRDEMNMANGNAPSHTMMIDHEMGATPAPPKKRRAKAKKPD